MSPDDTLADALSREADDAADDTAPVIDRRDPKVALAVAGIAIAAALVGALVALVISFAD
jgi:hypothetical protein